MQVKYTSNGILIITVLPPAVADPWLRRLPEKD